MSEERVTKKSWWRTIPGVLTAAAGMITAMTGLIVALHQTGILEKNNKTTPSTDVSQPSTTEKVGTGQPPPFKDGGQEWTVINGPTPDPKKTARELLTAWKQGDRDAALKVAKPDAVDKLFRASSELKKAVSSKDFTCYLAGTGQRDCQIEGILGFRLTETDQGWWVENVEY